MFSSHQKNFHNIAPYCPTVEKYRIIFSLVFSNSTVCSSLVLKVVLVQISANMKSLLLNVQNLVRK